MPGGDRTGPRGQGPRTGRGAGYCAGYDRPGFANPVPGYGMRGGGWGGGWGGGRGHRNRYYATGQPFWARGAAYQPESGQELDDLKQEAERLREQLEAINRRIEGLENQ